jgi:hypothetical protein
MAMKDKTTEDRLSAALRLVRAGKKWEARARLLDELRASSERRGEVLSILDKHFPLSARQRRALADLRVGITAGLDVMVDAPDPRFSDVLVENADEEPKAIEALLRVPEAYSAERLEVVYPSPSPPLSDAIERIRSGAAVEPPDEDPPPPPDSVPEDRMWGLVDEVRRADVAIYGSSEPRRKSTAKKRPATRRVRRARP